FKPPTSTPKPTTPPPPNLRQKLVDGVLTDYKSLRANPRLGGEDRMRLDRHIALLSDTQNALNNVNQPMATCTTAPARPSVANPSPQIGYAQRKDVLKAFNQVITSMIACGMCHSFISHFHSMLSDDYDNSWHGWAHNNAPEHVEQTGAILH